MDPIEAWIDRDELRRMAEALAVPPSRLAAATQPEALEGDFVGFTVGDAEAAPPEPAVPEVAKTHEEEKLGGGLSIEHQAREILSTARQIATRSGILTPASPTARERETDPPPSRPATPAPPSQAAPGPAPSSPKQVETPFVERLRAFGAWLREGIPSAAFFLTDREGGVLTDEVQSPKLRQVARTLAQASWNANRQAGSTAVGNLHIEIDARQGLEVIPMDSQYGPLVLGIVVPRPLSSGNVETVLQGLRQVLQGPANS